MQINFYEFDRRTVRTVAYVRTSTGSTNRIRQGESYVRTRINTSREREDPWMGLLVLDLVDSQGSSSLIVVLAHPGIVLTRRDAGTGGKEKGRSSFVFGSNTCRRCRTQLRTQQPSTTSSVQPSARTQLCPQLRILSKG